MLISITPTLSTKQSISFFDKRSPLVWNTIFSFPIDSAIFSTNFSIFFFTNGSPPLITTFFKDGFNLSINFCVSFMIFSTDSSSSVVTSGPEFAAQKSQFKLHFFVVIICNVPISWLTDLLLKSNVSISFL